MTAGRETYRSEPTAQKKNWGKSPQIAYDRLRELIVTMQLPAGARIEERLIVDELGISRTPVRQALMRMASEGLVELLPNQGARVPPLDLEELRAFFEAFEIMLKTTIHLAAIRHVEADLVDIRESRDAFERAAKASDVKGMIDTNEDFHLAIARAGHNSHLVRLVGDLLTKAIRLDGIWFSRQVRPDVALDLDKSQDEHRRLVAAIEARDVAEAERLTHEHVRSFREPFMNFLSDSAAELLEVSIPE